MSDLRTDLRLLFLSCLPFAERQIHGGEIRFSAFFHSVRLYSGKEDLCLRSRCPSHSDGRFRYKATERLPVFTPPGSYHLRVNVKDDRGDEVVCLKTKLHLLPAEL